MHLDKLRPVQRQSTEARVVEHLRDFLLSGEVPPGGRLTEIALADQLGVARTTLRMGLQRLAAEGIVVQIPYTGWQVASLSPQDVWELWTLRGSLESLAARLTAPRREAPLRQRLDRAVTALQRACDSGDLQRITEADIALHSTIVANSGHGRLIAQYQLVEHQVRLFAATSNRHVAEGPQDILAQHCPLIEALHAHDAEAAARAAWDHDAQEGARLTAWLTAQAAAPPETQPDTSKTQQEQATARSCPKV